MKILYKLLSFGAFMSLSVATFAQKDNVGIGTTKPDNSAVLELNSSSKGLLIPRMSLQQRSTIQNPATGLMVYQTDLISGFYYFDGGDWKPITGISEKSIADANNWGLTGNTGIGSSNFLGTINDAALKLRVNNVNAGSINRVGANTFYGYSSGTGATGTNNVGVGYETLLSATSGSSNVAIGYQSLRLNSSGANNLAIGNAALTTNTSGTGNVAIGTASLALNDIGGNNTAVGGSALNKIAGNNVFNVGVGTSAMFDKTSGSNNVGIGGSALRANTTGSNNTAIGHEAGRNSSAATGSVFIGYQAGQNETANNMLYIANSNTTDPLIKGEFGNKNLKINLGGTKTITQGFLAVGNFDTSFPMPTGNTYRLIVQDGIITEKVKVALKGTADWADYVFEPSYKLLPLEKVEEFVKENKHLPNVPSAEDMSKNGLDVTQTSAKLMEKIEELTLYMIEMNKEIKALKAENQTLKNNK